MNGDSKTNRQGQRFSDLFQDKKYLLKLYQALHPEDTGTTEDDLVDVTIQNVLTDGLYNDLGFRNKDRVVILAEAQSLCYASQITLIPIRLQVEIRCILTSPNLRLSAMCWHRLWGRRKAVFIVIADSKHGSFPRWKRENKRRCLV